MPHQAMRQLSNKSLSSANGKCPQCCYHANGLTSIDFCRDVNTAVDYVFTNNVRLAASAGAAAMNSGNYRPNNTVALFDSMKSRNEDGETVMD